MDISAPSGSAVDGDPLPGRRADAMRIATSSVAVDHLPILDVSRGIAAGYEAQAHANHEFGHAPDLMAPSRLDADGDLTACAISIALGAMPTLPVNTFLTLPIGAAVAATAPVRHVLGAQETLRGVVLDIAGFNGATPVGDLEYVLAQYRDNGALIAIGGDGAAQPELTSLVRLKPSILRLGRDWVRGVDRSAAKRSAIEVIGQLASPRPAASMWSSSWTSTSARPHCSSRGYHGLGGLRGPHRQRRHVGRRRRRSRDGPAAGDPLLAAGLHRRCGPLPRHPAYRTSDDAPVASLARIACRAAALSRARPVSPRIRLPSSVGRPRGHRLPS